MSSVPAKSATYWPEASTGTVLRVVWPPCWRDTVTVVPAGAPAETLEMTIPELSVAFDEEANSVSGRATPGGHLELNVGDAIARPVIGGGPGMGGGGFGGNRNAEPTINADGTWTQSFQPPYNVQPGSRANLIYRVPIGHRVSMTRYVPILVAQHGGSHACGLVGTPRDAVTADLNDAGGASLGHAEGPAGYNSQFDFELAKGGTPVTSAIDQSARGGTSPTPKLNAPDGSEPRSKPIVRPLASRR